MPPVPHVEHNHTAEPHAAERRPIDTTDRQLIVTLFVLALMVRILAAMAFTAGKGPVSDEQEYVDMAVNVVAGRGLAMVPQQADDGIARPTAFRMPGPSLLMAAVIAIFGKNIIALRALAVVCSSLSVPLLYLLVRRMDDRILAVVSATAAVFWPTWVYNSVTLLSEPYYVPLLLASLLGSVLAAERMTHRSAAVSGLLWGITSLVKPIGLPMTGLTGLYLWYRSGFRNFTLAFSIGAAFAVTLSPWMIRNAIVFDRFIPLATEGGETFLGTNNPYVVSDPAAHGTWICPLRIPAYAEQLKPVRDEVERSQMKYAIAKEYLRSHPHVIPKLIWWKWQRWLTPFPRTGGLVSIAVICSYGLLLVLLGMGFVLRAFRHSINLHIALLLVFTYFVITAVYSGTLTRGRMPLELVLLPWGLIAARRVALALPVPFRS